jgi:hypothetical protein
MRFLPLAIRARMGRGFAGLVLAIMSIAPQAHAQSDRPLPPGACIFASLLFSNGALVCVSSSAWLVCVNGAWERRPSKSDEDNACKPPFQSLVPMAPQ